MKKRILEEIVFGWLPYWTLELTRDNLTWLGQLL